ncbi:multi-sensor signal transduction histidine kinase [Cystobacter fuscus DSM 2262]|uniref:histidine kinase n=1 Tax=Cystobacter fuscus (strain ATCC 25194 / DSM 2262 / NBRC 100088 / M29) TaxID=1242864 RepID=S9QVN9_CYSF2|nr:PAS domain S-box protein [Cystobacter fuscus]EPX60728.1 multi-sensor signal transduction histidine kinase [Cystobacter fuscus DSM 2262]
MSASSSSTDLSDTLAEGLFQHPALLRALVDTLSERVMVSDATGRIIYFSPSALEFQGLGLKSMTQEEWYQHFRFSDPDTRAPVPPERLPVNRALRGEEAPFIDLFVQADHLPTGYYVRVSTRTVRDGQGRLLGVLLFLRDIAQERRAQAEQRRTEQRFHLIVEAAQEGIWMLDSAGRTTYANHYMARMLGYTVEEMLGQHVLAFVDADSHRQVTLNLERRMQGYSSVHDMALRHKDGRSIWTMLSSNPLRDEEGRYTGALATVTDITQRREAEQQVRRLNEELERRIAERTAQLEFSNRELEAFAYSVAHDLRAPLRAISTFSLALSEDCPGQLDATGEDYLQRIRGAAQRMSELIDGILTLSRVTSTGLQETDVSLSALARATAEQLQRGQPERTVHLRIQEGLVDRGDARMLRSVLENLLGNAWKFTRESPRAEIEFGALPGEGGPGRVYFVRDNGAGFDMGYQSRLFGVFQRLHGPQEFEGNGVGLATVRRIIQRHGGRVWGEGRVGQGATFFFTLHDTSSGGAPPSTDGQRDAGRRNS